jgi:hypothetical protein
LRADAGGARPSPGRVERVGLAWELGRALLNTDVMAAVAEAFDIEPQDLFRHPDQQSADALLRDQPAEIQDLVIRIIKAIPR